MASSERRETLAVALGKRRSKDIDEEEGEGEEEEREIEELGREVKAIAEKILESRRTMPERVLEAFSSHLVAQRSVLPQTGSEFSTSSSSLSERSEQAGTSGNLSSGTILRFSSPTPFYNVTVSNVNLFCFPLD